MAIPQLKLTAYQLSDPGTIRDLPSAKLNALADHLRDIHPVPLKPEVILEEIRKSLGENGANPAEAILRQSLSLCGMTRQMGISVEDVLKAISQGIVANNSWSPAEIEKWSAIERSFGAILSLPTVQRVAKTLDLSFEYANLLRRTRIVTDVRPIFDKDAKNIEGAVISHTLRIRFDSVDGEHGLSIAMDENDVRQLLDQCSRALVKSATARSQMIKAGFPAIVSGEASDGAK